MPKAKRKDERKILPEGSPEVLTWTGWHVKKMFDCFPAMEFTIEGEGGKLSCVYDPNIALTHLFNTYGQLCAIENIEDETGQKRNFTEDEKARFTSKTREMVDQYFTHSCELLKQKIKPKIEYALWELINEIMVRTISDLADKEDEDTSFTAKLAELERSFNRQRRYLWEAKDRGRPGSFNEDDVLEAFKVLGTDATQTQVADHLGVGVERMKQYRRELQFKDWKDLRRRFTRGL